MSFDKKALIQYRLEKATESLEEADALAKIGHWATVANRLYYACFYAITAYLAQEIQAITHTGVKSAFHNNLIKQGIMSLELGKLYNDLFNKRQEADYQDFAVFEKKTIEPLMSDASKFIEQIKVIIYGNLPG